MKVISTKSVSVSFKKSAKQTSISHNNRDLDYEQKQNQWHKHIDHERSSENKYLVQKDIKEMYEEIFGDAVAEYNAKQKRNDRKIKNYYSKVLKDKKLEPQREFILQLGDKNDFESGTIKNLSDVSNEILEKYVENFENRNPNLKIYNAVIHNDEASPHLHLNVIPVASGYKRGVQLQPSFDKALKQQNIDFDKSDSRSLMKNFREREVAEIEKMLLEFEISRKEVGTNHIKDHHEYKKLHRELETLEEKFDVQEDAYLDLEAEVEKLSSVKDSLKTEVQTLVEKKEMLAEELSATEVPEPKAYKLEGKEEFVAISRKDYHRYVEQNELVPVLVQQNKSLKKEVESLLEENSALSEENEKQADQINQMQRLLLTARVHVERLMENGQNLWDRAVTYASKFYPKGKEIIPAEMQNNAFGERDYINHRNMHHMRGRER